MAHWKSFCDREFLYSFDLQGRDVDVKIAKVTGGEITGTGGKKSKKPKIYFEGKEKPLIANPTNCKTIASIVGDPDVEKWVGQWITLFPTTCQGLSGETVDCIRVRPRAPQRTEGGGGSRARGSVNQPADPQTGAQP